ncbi:MAG: hypothetical protein MZV63_65040 [Marinilabiliales bacterium]|nr:hypothetical protein [Marinilabiliales bacterium]
MPWPGALPAAEKAVVVYSGSPGKLGLFRSPRAQYREGDRRSGWRDGARLSLIGSLCGPASSSRARVPPHDGRSGLRGQSPDDRRRERSPAARSGAAGRPS